MRIEPIERLESVPLNERHYSFEAQNYENLARRNGGTLCRSDWWRHEYLRFPYLAEASLEDLQQRFLDVHVNQFALNDEGQLGPDLGMTSDSFIMRRFAHIDEEWKARLRGVPGEHIRAGNEPLKAYLRDGCPSPGVLMMREHRKLPDVSIVKYSKLEFVRDMLDRGRFRIAPASSYSVGGLLYAQADLEMERTWLLPSFANRMTGRQRVRMFGKDVPLPGGDVPFRRKVSDYYLWSACREVDYRLPTDFEADAALIVLDGDEFSRRLFKEVRRTFPRSIIASGQVEYFDPYDIPKIGARAEFLKHFRFYYQKEFRIVIRPAKTWREQLEPFFVELGPLHDIAKLAERPTLQA